MTTPLLETKLLVPGSRRDIVPRPELQARLAATVPLTLVSAPAGFGKTTLLTSWLARDPADPAERADVWVSLDQRDSDAAVFWTYLATALGRSVPGVGASALAMLASGGWPTDAVVTQLINDLTGVDHDVVAVLDDYHVIDSTEVHDGVAFLLDHLPPNVHLVIATRADPPLPLARLRARGQLVEIRAADLRFTAAEAEQYLNDVMGLALTDDDVTALERRTEGWIAALQLAALSVRGRDDPAEFIAEFSGDDRYIVDYLVEEVLEHQPETVRAFLLQTSILSRLTGSLCDAVTGCDDGTATLTALARDNLFLTPLDPRRQWYRYHHLFADVLQARLLDEQPDQIAELHRRASAWHQDKGDRTEAIVHALAAADFERAADLVETAVPELRRNRQDATLRGWLQALPDESVRARPGLSVAYAGALLVHGELDGAEARLRDAEARLAELPANDPARARLPASIALFRAAQARITGDSAGLIEQAERAAALAAEDDHLARGAAAGLLGIAYWSRGDLGAGYRSWAQAASSLEQAGHYADVLGCTIALADIAKSLGRLHDATSACERGLSLAADHGPLRGLADMHVALAELLLERNDLDGARQHLTISQDLGDPAALPQNRYRQRVALARLRHIEGDPAGALELLDEAERLYVSDYFPEVAPVAAVRARLQLAQGNVAAAQAWARRRNLSADDELSYLHEYEHVTLARILMAQGEAGRLLRRLLDAAESAGRTGTVIEVLVLQAVADHAGAALKRALTLAEPEGYARVFLDAGPAIVPMLTATAKQDGAPPLAGQLLAAATPTAARRPAVRPGLVEPLSGRELDVLRLLGTDLNGPDIARELVVSLNTVRTHTKNIYAKLGVTSRRAAVRRADELGLLA